MAKNRFNVEQTSTSCKKWQLSKSNDNGIIDQYGSEALAIAGSDLNVFKLLGVHEQGKLIDLTDSGIPISGGTASGSSMLNAFTDNVCSKIWRSSQQGSTNILSSAYIGYNFGTPKLVNGRNRYGCDVDVKQRITTIKIKQSDDSNRRVLTARVERSDDGIKWFGVALINLPNDNNLNQVSFSKSSTTRYWRIRPTSFTGSLTDFWEVQSLELIDWDSTNLFQVQDDYGWIENRDRDYAKSSIVIKGYYELFNKDSDLSQFGFMPSGGSYDINVNFNDIVQRLGRPIVIGDIFELPSEAMFNPEMVSIKKYLEVTDVSWSSDGYTPGWAPTMLRVVAEPMIAKQETQDIIGDLAGAIDQSGLLDIDESKYSELAIDQSERGREKAEEDIPMRGSDTSNITSYDESTLKTYSDAGLNLSKISLNQKALYVEDALPKNGELYTEGTSFPTNPLDGAYHRVTYVGLSENVPARLFKYSTTKAKWLFVEADLRKEYTPQKPELQKLKDSKDAISPKNLGR
jgi:hypothetical protein